MSDTPQTDARLAEYGHATNGNVSADAADAAKRCEELRASASTKLTADERMACGLA